MATISLRLDQKEASLFKKYAETYGMTLTDLIRTSVLERIEDEHDLKELEEALANPDPVYYTHEEVKKELGL